MGLVATIASGCFRPDSTATPQEKSIEDHKSVGPQGKRGSLDGTRVAAEVAASSRASSKAGSDPGKKGGNVDADQLLDSAHQQVNVCMCVYFEFVRFFAYECASMCVIIAAYTYNHAYVHT